MTAPWTPQQLAALTALVYAPHDAWAGLRALTDPQAYDVWAGLRALLHPPAA